MKILAFLIGGISLFFVHGASAVDADIVSVSVMEGDAVTLHSVVKTNQQDRMTWFFKDNRIALINGVQSKVCTDEQCKEIFRDRLNVNRTGSLTITNINTTDSGDYQLKITNRNIAMIFSVTVHDVSAEQQDGMRRKSAKEGGSVTLNTGVIKNTNILMTWFFNDIFIAENTGNQSKICTDDQCKERLRDRLKLDHQTGSLTITNTRTTDSGLYELKISSSRFSIIKSFSVAVTDVTDSESSSAAVVVVPLVGFLLLIAVAAVVCYHYKCQAIRKCNKRQHRDERDGAGNLPNEQNVLMETNNPIP